MSLRGETRASVADGVILLLIGVVLIAVGGYLLGNAGRVTGEAVPVDALVLDSSVEPADAGGYVPVVEYEYTYEDETYVADGVYGDGPRPTSADRARQIAGRYPNGSTVTAYVDADDPAAARLVPDPPSPLYYLFVLGGALSAALGAAVLANRTLGIGS